MDCSDVTCPYIYGENEPYTFCNCPTKCPYDSEFESGVRTDCEGCKYLVNDAVYVNHCRLSRCIYDDSYD